MHAHTDAQARHDLDDKLERACDDYRQFVDHILKPARGDLEKKVRGDVVTLHHVLGINLIAAHSVDYLLAVRAAAGMTDTRKELVSRFDELFSVPGGYIRNLKMELIDAINNGLKHIRLDPVRYKNLGKRYGQISFRSLVEHEGRVFCHLQDYKFDYCRVVLLPALQALSSWDLETSEDVVEFARGKFEVSVPHALDLYEVDDPSTAIDQLVEMLAIHCVNCDEPPNACCCSQYVFDGIQGQYEPLHATSEGHIDALLNLISPSFSRS